jgi:hypothetical protein
MARQPDIGESKTFSVTVPAGLYKFLTLHARRAIDGKNEGEIALCLMRAQAGVWDRDRYLGIAFPNEEFLKPEKPQRSPRSKGSSKGSKS